MPLVKVFVVGDHGSAFGELDILSVAEKTAIGAVYLFLYHKSGVKGGMVTDLLHEGAVEVVLDGTVFFECQHSVLFFGKGRAPECRFQIFAKYARIWK